MPPAPDTWTNVDRMRQYRGLLRHVPHPECGDVRRGIPTFEFACGTTTAAAAGAA